MLSEKQKRIMFNGRTLKNDFRRGFWKKTEYDVFSGKKPSLPMDEYKAFLWYNGCVAFYINDDKQVIVNSDVVIDDDIKDIIDVLMEKNNLMGVKNKSLGKATRINTSRLDERLMI